MAFKIIENTNSYTMESQVEKLQENGWKVVGFSVSDNGEKNARTRDLIYVCAMSKED